MQGNLQYLSHCCTHYQSEWNTQNALIGGRMNCLCDSLAWIECYASMLIHFGLVFDNCRGWRFRMVSCCTCAGYYILGIHVLRPKSKGQDSSNLRVYQIRETRNNLAAKRPYFPPHYPRLPKYQVYKHVRSECCHRHYWQFRRAMNRQCSNNSLC